MTVNLLRRISGAVLLAATCALPPTLAAQTASGTISGRVVDTGGLAVPGATVSAESPGLQGVRTTTTSANGDYIFPQLPPGEYSIRFELSGFATTKHVRSLGAAQTIALDATMSPATVTETVTVSGAYRRVHEQRAGSDEPEAGAARDAAHGADAARRRGPRAGDPRNRPERQHQHRRRDVVRERLPAQRRANPRQPARHPVQPLHRGRHPGDHRRHVRCLGGIWPVLGRRRERGHAVGRQRVQRLVPDDVHQ